MRQNHSIKILGINFFKGDVEEVVYLLKSGGLLVVPAAPALVNITQDTSYYQSLQCADIVIPDSAFMTLVWNLISRERIYRISGLAFLKTFLTDKEVISSTDIMLVDPRSREAASNLAYLRSNGFTLNNEISYVAPIYDKARVEDEVLLDMIEEKKPRFVLINLGGGTQEKLGAYLKERLSYTPAIICTGAAIAFLTGQQVKIPTWVDKYYLGWLFRCFEKPGLYVPRYMKGFRLLKLLLSYGKEAPVLHELAD